MIFHCIQYCLARFGLTLDEEGASAVEYGLIVTLIALAIIAGATALGAALSGKFFSASGTLGGAAAP